MGCGWPAANLDEAGCKQRPQSARSDVLVDECTGFGIAGKRVVPGEVLRQQHKEHDANRPHILSHIGNRDLLQESHTNNNDRCTQTLWRSASSAAMYLMVPLPNRDDSPCVCAIPKSHMRARRSESILGLMSRRTMALECRYVSAATSADTWRRICSSDGLFMSMAANKSPWAQSPAPTYLQA
jgi:hypothetical protein